MPTCYCPPRLGRIPMSPEVVREAHDLQLPPLAGWDSDE